MKIPFREHHLLSILHDYEKSSKPLDFLLSQYFRAHKAIGSKDRAFIAETAYGMVRWRLLLDHLCGGGPRQTWKRRYDKWQSARLEDYSSNENIPLNVRCSCPDVLFKQLEADYGLKTACKLALESNSQAPTYVRVNTLKTSREALLERWQDLYSVSACKDSPLGIVFHKKINFYALPEFKEGFFEIQDEASQEVAMLAKVEPGELVLDYCAGAGGKALAIAPQLQNKGQLFLHDIRSHALIEARKRLRRAGIHNAQTIESDSPQLKKLKKKMDWVIVDAPCSGTGTLRRNPDMKWRLDEYTVPRLIGEQRSIFEKALSFLNPEGKILYITCSLLKDENERQAEHFCKTYQLTIVGKPYQSLPDKGKKDGFFACLMEQKEKAVKEL